MPKREVAPGYVLTVDGKRYQEGDKVELSDKLAKHYEKTGRVLPGPKKTKKEGSS